MIDINNYEKHIYFLISSVKILCHITLSYGQFGLSTLLFELMYSYP